ncbi:MAG: ROK family protein [Gemmatimonadaceae bacterium]
MRLAGAIDIGGTRTKLGVVAEDGRIVERATVSTPRRGDPEPLVDAIASVIPRVTRNLQLAGIGVSVAGFLDREHETMYANANLPLLVGFPLRRELERRLERECRLEVDSNAAVVAEFRFGAGKGAERLLGVTVGTGLGGGVIVAGKLLRHTGECAGDLGHIILDPNGRRCTCGARGCLEAMVCSAALSERAGGNVVRDIVRDAGAGDEGALKAIEETGKWLGLGLASLAPLFAPDTIVVGGGVAASGDLLLEPVRAAFREHAGDDLRDRVRIAGSTLEGWEGMIGAASLVFDPMG